MSRRAGNPPTGNRQADILAAGVWRDDLYVDHGISGASASRPQFDRVFAALTAGDTLIITTLDRPGRSTQNMLVIAEELRSRGAGLRVLNLGGARTDGTRDQARASDSTQRGCCVHERVVERVSDIKRLRRLAHGDRCVRSTSCASRWGRGPVPSLVNLG